MAKAVSKNNTGGTAKKSVPASEAKTIAKKLGVSLLFSNSKGEYFTDHNRALLSDKAENVKEHRFNADELDTEDKAEKGEPVKSAKKVLTEDDFKTTPELKEKGYKVGDEIEVPVTE